MRRVVLLTPAGRGAIATLLMEGPGALDAVAPGYAAGDRLRLVRVGPEPAEQIVLHAERDDRVQLHCHGGAAVVGRIVDLLGAKGWTAVDWREWADAQHADPIESAAVKALAAAPTFRTAAILVDQYRGALRAALARIDAALSAGPTVEARRELHDLAQRIELGRHLIVPWRIVIAGAPNVGKSTLVNALLGYQRAIVHPTPGTTRDLVTATTAIDGWPVELVDTAGLRRAEHSLEQAGVDLARRELNEADLVLLVVDRSRPFSEEDQRLATRLRATLIVENKSDLAPCARAAEGVEVSAVTGQGLAPLLEAIARRLVPRVPAPGAAVPFTAEQAAGVSDRLRKLGGTEGR